MADIEKEENIKDLLKPIRKQAEEATGIQKVIYSEMLRQINERFPQGKVSRLELFYELERQRKEAQKYLEDDKRWVADE